MNPTEEVLKSDYVQTIQETDFEAKRKSQVVTEKLTTLIKNDCDLSFGLLYTFIYEFFKNGAQESLEAVFSSDGDQAAFIDTAFRVLNIFKGVKSILGDKPQECLLRILKNYVLKYIEGITPKEIKDVDKDSIVNGLKSIDWLLRKDPQSNSEDTLNEYILEFFLKMIQSPYFERKLRGIADINERILSVSSTKASEEATRKLVRWINHSNVLKLIYNENSHAEIIRKGIGILIFLAKNKAITKAMIDIVWNCQLDKHEDIIRAVYFCVEGIVRYLPIPVPLA